MTILYHVYIEDGNGEIEGFLDEQGKFLQGWSMNDADWRSEYMNPLLESLGYTVKESRRTEHKETLKITLYW